jgi:hypothetical protein
MIIALAPTDAAFFFKALMDVFVSACLPRMLFNLSQSKTPIVSYGALGSSVNTFTDSQSLIEGLGFVAITETLVQPVTKRIEKNAAANFMLFS